ncbi:helix-turn-helix domain-containing protein [Lysinibacillus sphaericus]|nr:helix-turn-helix domain-containing protein [Lysinibacillus sphaericus]
MKEYKVKEVADLLDKHEETIKRWIRSGNSLTHIEIAIKKVGE